MDRNKAIQKAKLFAQTAYAAESENIIREHHQKLREVLGKLSERGMTSPDANLIETAKIHGEQIKALIQVRLKTLLEGYELHGVSIDDQMANTLVGEIIDAIEQMVTKSRNAVPIGTLTRVASQYCQIVSEKAAGLSPAWIKTQIDRSRLMPKKNEGSTTIYHVQGDNARLNVNSSDTSVNIVNKSPDELFAVLRAHIQSEVPEGDERKKILDSLSLLQSSREKPSYAQRYTEFIATAANHMALIAPFIPASLTEMLYKAL